MFLSNSTKKFFAILFIASAQTGAFAVGNLEEGKKLYAEGRLEQAAKCFYAELAEDPHDAAAHYLLGNVFLALQHIPSALSEYRKCIALDPHGQAGKLSRSAMASISAEGLEYDPMAKSAATAAAAAAAAVSAGAAGAPAAYAANGTTRAGTAGGAPGHGATDSESRKSDENLTRTSATSISKQTDERAQAAVAERDMKIKQIMAEGDERVKKVEKEMYEVINGFADSEFAPVPRYGQRPVNFQNQYGQARETYSQRIRNQYQPQIDAIKEETRRRSDDVVSYYHQRAAAIEDAALSLDHAYVTPGNKLKLNPLGTNTYVRMYETADEPSGSIVPVQAAPAKALNSKTTPPVTNKQNH
jgi:tetratricopeptide (TPR) repeat protein